MNAPPPLHAQTKKIDPEHEAIMWRQRRALDADATTPESPDTPLKGNALHYHELPSFIFNFNGPTNKSKITKSKTKKSRKGEVKERVKTHFSKVAESQEKRTQHFQQIAQQQDQPSVPDPHDNDAASKTKMPIDYGKETKSVENSNKKCQDHPVEPILKKGHSYVVKKVHVSDSFGNSGKYSGQFLEGKPNGLGIMKYASGTTYEGQWKDGKWHGKGITKFACGDVYEGTYSMDRRNGYGLYKWKDGRIYEGEFYLDERQGLGDYKWSDGAKYHGEFLKGCRHGQGVQHFSDFSVYRGAWRKGKMHGVGEIQWKDGRSYKGEWRDGRASGKGVGVRAEGSVLHDGDWSRDRPVR